MVIALAGCSSNSAAPSPRGSTPTPNPTTAPTPTPAPTSTVQVGHIQVGSLTRDYRVVVPSDVAERASLPLVLVLHWLGATIDDVASATGYDALALDPGAVVVYPAGYQNSWNAGTCCDPAVSDKIDDVGFLGALIDQMTASYPIDPNRVFVWGASTGGQMAYRAACELSGRIAAVADISGNMITPCAPKQPVSIIDIHGTADSDVPYEGCADGSCPAVPAVMEQWRQLDGCTGEPADTNGGQTVETAYTSCQGGTAVDYIKAIGVGHSLDGIQVDVPAVTWAFFMNHARTG